MEWILIITVMWGDGHVGGEGLYHSGPYPTLETCMAAPAKQIMTMRVPVSANQNPRIVRMECVLKDNARAS